MYEELIKSLRICGDWTEQVRLVGRDCCDGCKYKKDGVCESFKGNKELLLIEAADAIEELQKDRVCRIVEHDGVTELSVVPRWIPVTETPPLKVGEDGYNGYLVYANGYYAVADYTTDKFDNVPYFHVDGEYEPDVTHWMPLPTPPEGESYGV